MIHIEILSFYLLYTYLKSLLTVQIEFFLHIRIDHLNDTKKG